MADENIIFLISQPRSGSTMLQAILGSHPDIFTCSEPWIALPFVYALGKDGSEFEFNGQWARDAINSFFEENCIDKEFYYSALNSFLSSFYNQALLKSDKKIFLDKTPRYYEIASNLIKIFPNAKFIVLYRHPLSVLNSILTTWVKGEIDKLFYFSRDLFVAPKKLTGFVSENKERICLVRYENLVRSPDKEVKKICQYLGVEYVNNIVRYNVNHTWVFGDKKFALKNTPDTKSLEQWQTQLDVKLKANFFYYYLTELGEELFDSLGYDFSASLKKIEKYQPNKKDYRTWVRLVHNYDVVSLNEQRLTIKRKISLYYLRSILKNFIA